MWTGCLHPGGSHRESGLAAFAAQGMECLFDSLNTRPRTRLLSQVKELARRVHDHRALSKNYVQHWGDVFVAGKSISAGNQNQVFEIAVPGTYAVESGKIIIDDDRYSAASLPELSRGAHTASGERLKDVTLRWGDCRHRPACPWPEGAELTEF